jgi:predicted kinase
VIVWINGAFGSGKSTVAAELRRLLPSSRHFDPEYVGFVLRRVRRLPTGDFQDLPSWRRWVVRVGRAMATGGRPVVVPMALLDPAYREEIMGGLRRRGVPVRQFVLRVPEPTLRARIDGDLELASARVWRHAQVDRALAELEGLASREPHTIEVDNAARPAPATAAEIAEALRT